MEIIEAGMDITKKSSEHTIKFDPKVKQINFADERVYEVRPKVYYPSMTRILRYFPKGKFFEQWLKEVGTNADIISEKAAKEGTQVHNLIEEGIKKRKVEWLDTENKAKYSQKVWEMVIRFNNFWSIYSPEPILVEEIVYSDTEKFAGTVDLVVKLDGKVWLIDIKTSNGLYRSYDLQVAGYAKALKEYRNIKVDKIGIIWLKSHKRGATRKQGKYQGKGWEIHEVEDIEGAFQAFQNINKIYQYDNPVCNPLFKTLPTVLHF